MIKRPRSSEKRSGIPGPSEMLSISFSVSRAAEGGHSLQLARTVYPSLKARVFCSPALTGELPGEMVCGQFIKNNQA